MLCYLEINEELQYVINYAIAAITKSYIPTYFSFDVSIFCMYNSVIISTHVNRYFIGVSTFFLFPLQSDLANRRKFTPEDIEKFAKEHNFIHHMETSVKNNVNVSESMQ